MKLHMRHTFPCTLEQWWTAFWTEDIEERLRAKMRAAGEDGGRREPLSEVKEGDVVVSTQRYHTGIELPKMVADMVGSKTLHYDQVSRIDQTRNRVDWEVVPSAQAHRVKAVGTVLVREVPEGVERVIEGVVEVKVPLVGSRIEKNIVEGIQKGHDADHVERVKWLRETYG